MFAFVADRALVQKMTSLTMEPKPRLNFLSAGFLPHGRVKRPAEQTRKGQGCKLAREVQCRVLVRGKADCPLGSVADIQHACT